MCCGMGCPFEKYDGGCSYDERGCYAEKRDRLDAIREAVARQIANLEDQMAQVEDDIDAAEGEAKIRLQEQYDEMWAKCGELENEYKDLEYADVDDYEDIIA